MMVCTRFNGATANVSSLRNASAQDLYKNRFAATLSQIGAVTTKDISPMESSAQSDVADILCEWSLDICESRISRSKYEQDITWELVADVEIKTLHDGVIGKFPAGTVILKDLISAPRTCRHQVFNQMGGLKTGFSYKADADVQALMGESIKEISKKLVERLAKVFKEGKPELAVPIVPSEDGSEGYGPKVPKR